jgi:hypothetical protein
MSRLSKRLVSITASTVLLSLVSAGANAQGTWYTDFNAWSSLVTNVQTATYDSRPTDVGAPRQESGITATTGSGIWYDVPDYLSPDQPVPITFTFAGNAFGGYFAIDGQAQSGTMEFTVDGSSQPDRNVINRKQGYTFFGYISDSASDINVTVSTPTGFAYVAVDSFSRANSTNASNPGSNVAPEPGSFALALTGGAALIGICIRRRRNAA